MRVGVIGLGTMGLNHARIYSNFSKLAGIADTDDDKVKKAAAKYAVPWYVDYKALLKNVDAVTIATPTSTHYNIALDAINAGKHVLIEKPICDRVEDAKDLIKKAARQGVILAVGHTERHNPAVKFAKNSLRNGRFGDLISISSKRVSSFPTRIRDVGVILDLGIHEIDVMRYITSSEVKLVNTLAGTCSANKKLEDHASILLQFENRVHGIVEINWLTPMKVRKLSLTCTKNFVELDYIDQSLQISSSTVLSYDIGNLSDIPLEYNTQKVSLKKQEPLENEIVDFLESIEKGKKPLVTGEDGLRALQVALAAMSSYKLRRVIAVDKFHD